MKLTKEDYIYCEDCENYVDFWRYDRSIKDTDHSGHNWRYVTEEELKVCIQDCMDDGCIKKDNGEYEVVE